MEIAIAASLWIPISVLVAFAVYERPASFEPQVRNLKQRLFDAYAAEAKRVSGNDEEDGLKYLSDSDLEAIADYLFAQPPMVHDVAGKR